MLTITQTRMRNYFPLRSYDQLGWRICFRLSGYFVLVCIVFFMITLDFGKCYKTKDLNKRLNNALSRLENLRTDNAELDAQLVELQNQIRIQTEKNAKNAVPVAPSKEYEILRRRIFSNTKEFWYYINSELKSLGKQVQGVERIGHMEISVGERYRSLLKDISDLTKVDDYATWRQEESENLSSLVQNRLDDLQNPAECSKAKQLVCNLKKKCSFGCQLHHIVYCFIVAYATRRTFVLDSENWSYAAKWQNIFFPLSDTCSFSVNRTIVEWSGIDDKYAQVIFLPIIDELRNRPSYLPQNIPYDLASRLSTLHGDPIVWWIGQFLKYLIRPQAITSRQLDEYAKKVKFQKPIVGVHIRRTDTIIYEAKIHKLDEYMTHVEEYYKIRQLQSDAVIIKRIYLATDDPTLFTEAKLKYPEYEIIGDEEISRTTDVLVYHNVALNGIVDDIYFLSLCDYLVCTFSSQVCRTAYEIMNTLHPDASSLYTSLDDVYYYGGQNFRLNKAVLAHESDGPDEIDLQVNDEIHVAGNHWNGYSKGTNIRTGITGLYPTFKVVPVIQSANFSLHNEQYTEF